MPLVPAHYRPPYRIFKNGDCATLYAALFRKVTDVQQHRERLELPDGDFMDLDWSYAPTPAERCLVVFHGLEGHAARPYILGMAKAFLQKGYDCCAPNFRGCSGEKNRVFGAYHSGKTEDVSAVLQKVIGTGKYKEIVLAGFSLGGNLILKFLGDQKAPDEVKAALAVSAPVDLTGTMYELHRPRNLVYSADFLWTLKKKLTEKAKDFPEKVSKKNIRNIRTLKAYDDFYTAKSSGFADAMDYYKKCSALPVLPDIQIPTLLINARNDSFLSESCYPEQVAADHPFLYLQTPVYGGHVGFVEKNNLYYHEKQALEFIEQHSH